MTFSADPVKIENSIVFQPKGKLLNDADSIHLNKKVEEELGQNNWRIIFDVSLLENCNSSGLNVLIKTLTKTRIHGGDTVICAMNDQLNKLFAITKLNEIFSLYPTQELAVKHFNQ